ncbi:MAG: chemotaxis protein CheW [Spirochaetota bacterium]
MNMEHTVVETRTDSTQTDQFVTFIIGNEVFGVEVLKVQEIIGMTHITHVPNTLPYMKGVINLRGSVVPVIDMRKKIGLEEIEYTAFTVIIITEIKGKLIGMIVDSVEDVVAIPVEKIQDAIHFTSQVATDYIKGIGQLDDNLIIILDVDKLLTTDELARIKTE